MVRLGHLLRLDMDFEKSLESSLLRHLARETGTPSNLAEAIRYSLLAPGKRIRPRLLIECGRMLQVNETALVAAAVALEMVHCFTLIHDDLPCMDNDDFRRGMPSSHKKFGESLALLAGDALLSLGFDSLFDSADLISPLFFQNGLKRFAWAIGPRGVVGGQAAEALVVKRPTLIGLTDMHARKTGALFSAALLIPMDFAGISESSPRGSGLVAFAATLGNAFQIADDLEDEESYDPMSILFYKNAKAASEDASQTLSCSIDSLKDVFGRSSDGLTGIAQSVLKELKKAIT
ncbi:MAG: polyprenyl synthetase family protein [Bdellovibrionota bacterium]